MRNLRARREIALVALVSASVMVLASCSSDAEPAASSASATSASAMPSPMASMAASASAVPAGAAAVACAAYFDLDLLNSSYAGGAVDDGDMTEEQVREQFQTRLKELVAQSKEAVADGTGSAKLVANAKRMKRLINGLPKGAALSDLSTKKQTRFAKSSLRVQKACDSAGFPLPEDNITARTAAGL